jgi:DNA-binding MarR family transcriptional regulator
MTGRNFYIEEIINNMQAMRRSFFMQKTGSSEALKEWGDITMSQWAVIAVLTKKEKIGITELAKNLNISRSAATQFVDELVGKGYIVRSGKKNDKRALELEFAEKYKKKIIEMRKKKMIRFKKIFSALDDKELMDYANLNKKLTNNILKK